MAAASPLLARFAREPARAAVLLDVDGTLAPIVDRPEDARVPDDTRAELRRLVGLPAVGGVVAGTWLQQRLPMRAISLVFAAVLVLVAVDLLVP